MRLSGLSALHFLLLFFFYEKISYAPKAPKAQRHNQAKAQNAASKQKKKMRLKLSRRKKSHLFAYLHFCAFCTREEKKIEKREKSPQCKCTKYRCPYN